MRTKAIGPGEERERDGGDSSDSSLEEIPEAYFNNNNRRRRRRFHGAGRDARSRVWPAAEDGGTKRRPPYPPHSHILPGSNYTSNLYNFAWAQAVQNKPLGFADAAAVPPDDNDDRVPDSVPPDGETSDGAVVEEGELEEGEIDDLEFLGESKCDSPVSPVLLEVEEDREVADVGTSGPINEDDQNKMNADNNNNNNNDDDDIVEDAGIGNDGEITGNEEEEEEEEDDGDGNMDNLDMRVISVLEELETISEEDAEKSFQGACSRLTTALDDLQKMILKGHLHVLDAVIQQAFFALQTIHSVFLKGQEKNKDVYCRLLASVKGQKPLVFASSEHLKEIDSMIQALGSEYANKFAQVPLSVSNLTISNVGNAENITCHSSKLHALPPIVVPRSRKDYIPLLDPHVDHEESSLPSPTSHCATPSLLPRATTVHFGDSTTLQPTSCKQDVSNGNTILPYVTDAVTAVSSYQQKYNYIPCLSNNQLPSPTPSEESNDKFGDCNGEVSSSSFVANARKMYVNSASMSTTINTVNSGGVGFGPHQVGYKPAPSIKSSAKSRDPRIKISTSYAVGPLDFNKQHSSSRNVDVGNEVHDNISQKFGKQKSVNFHTLNSRSVKRQRNESPIGRDLQNLSSRGGWLEDDGVMKHINNSHPMEIVNQTNLDALEITSNTRQRLLVTNTNETVSRNKPTDDRNMIAEISLPSLLKGIAVNPTILMQLLKDQQRLAAESQQKTANFCQETSSSSVNTSTRTAFSPDNTIKVHEIKEKPAGNSQTNPQVAVTGPQHEAGVLRMKPRDPRRILHNNITRNIGSLNSEHFSITNQKRECSTIKKQGEQAQTSGAPSQTAFPPDILSQLNKKLTNVPDIMSTKPIESVVIPQNYSQLVPIKSEGTNISQGPLSTDQLNNVSTSPSANPWGDVDHLLEGYDEKQKAVFQKERARRIEEQSKMFSARKLCLVLDLDHTLLNSAKFSEVDQLHDDILKKKEEQDREKPQRHLFRFQHMGMWTKLRPGIWNFLEKASRLFELHLYTMGNNLYATEMAKVLDPTGTLFSGRVISKGDDNDPFDSDDRVPKSKDLEGVLGMESAVVIIDDSIRVWPHHKLNLIVVERYTYFPSSRRQFGLLGPSLLEIDHDERPEEGTLASSLAVIEKIHQNFFAHPSLIDIDVRNILASEQRKILSGCRIVFSRIFPVGEANPHLHPLWQTAEQFGAVCTNQIDDQVTHVVANSLGTDKVNWALSTGRFVVHPGWVEASALLYRRASEVDFAVKL